MAHPLAALVLSAATVAIAAPAAQAARSGSGTVLTSTVAASEHPRQALGRRPPCLPCLMVPARASAPAPGAADPVGPATGGPHPFTLYDNTHYAGLDLEQYGLVRSDVLYEDAAGAQAIAAGHAPNEATFKMRVTQQDRDPGPLVLDFEDLYLTGSRTTAAFHLRVLTLLARWAHEAAPGKVIGFYGLLGHTNQMYVPLARKLAPYEGAFFPSLYTFDDDRRRWQQRLLQDLEMARQIAPGKPIYPYLWPQYHEGTPKALQYLDASYWLFQLRTCYRYASGAVIWSGGGPTGSDRWVAATIDFMRATAGQ